MRKFLVMGAAIALLCGTAAAGTALYTNATDAVKIPSMTSKG